MRKLYFLYSVAALTLVAGALQSCKKSTGIVNNNVISTPYTLFFADTAGSLFNTNDGINIKSSLFPSDGYPSRAICYSNNTLLWIKHNIYYSNNNATNFNAANLLLNPFSGLTTYTVADSAFNQTVILKAADDQKIYVAVDDEMVRTFWPPVSYGLGIAYSNNDGNPKSWLIDSNYDQGINATNVRITTLTQLKNNTIFAYDQASNRLFNKLKTATDSAWHETNMSTTNGLPTPNSFTLAHFNNMLVVVDYKNSWGAYYSLDNGVDWFQFHGLPATKHLYYASSPFDQVLLVGTDSMGVYKLSTDDLTLFKSANIGLESFTSVRSIAAKENVIKNEGITMQYIYLATDKGIYRSQDLGESWIKVVPGNFVSIY
jgi:hypothetical protein